MQWYGICRVDDENIFFLYLDLEVWVSLLNGCHCITEWNLLFFLGFIRDIKELEEHLFQEFEKNEFLIALLPTSRA